MRMIEMMIKRALKSAIGPSLGVVIGHIIASRGVFSYLHNETYPPLLVHAGLSFAVTYTVSFLVHLLIQWSKSSCQANRNFPLDLQ